MCKCCDRTESIPKKIRAKLYCKTCSKFLKKYIAQRQKTYKKIHSRTLYEKQKLKRHKRIKAEFIKDMESILCRPDKFRKRVVSRLVTKYKRGR